MRFQDLPDELQNKIMYSYNIHPVAEIFKQGIEETLNEMEGVVDYSSLSFSKAYFMFKDYLYIANMGCLTILFQ